MKTPIIIAYIVFALSSSALAQPMPTPADVPGFVLIFNDENGIGYLSKEKVTNSKGLAEFSTITMLAKPITLSSGKSAIVMTGENVLDCVGKRSRLDRITMVSREGEILSNVDTEKEIGVKWVSVTKGGFPQAAHKIHCKP